MKLLDYEFSKATRRDTGLLDFIKRIGYILNLGRYQMRVVTTVPTHTGEAGEHLFYISSSVKRFYWYDATNSTWQYAPTIVASASLTGQDAAISATTLFTPTAVGTYEISVYQVITKAGSAGTLACVIGWTDNEQAQTSSPASNLDMTSLGAASSGVLFIQSTAVAITYTTTIAGAAGAPEYDLYIVLKQQS